MTSVVEGRAAFAAQLWGEAYRAEADDETALELDDLEQLALAAYLSGHDEAAIDAWTRAHHEALRRGDPQRAARAGISILSGLIFRGDVPPGMGWLTRVAGVLAGCDRCAEHAWIDIWNAFPRMFGGDPKGAEPTFVTAVEEGEGFGDVELVTMARVGVGMCRVMQGVSAEGVALLDEAMVAVTSGEVSPMYSGIVYCSVITACSQIFDVRRASKWTTELARWCDSQPDLVPFRGVDLTSVLDCKILDEGRVRSLRTWADRRGIENEGLAAPELLLAYGSNASAACLSRKLADCLDAALIPVAKATLADFEVVYSAHLSSYGAIPATLQHSPGARTAVCVLVTTPAQCRLLRRTEPNYHFAELEDVEVKLELGPTLSSVSAVISRHGALTLDGAEVGVAAVDTLNHRFSARTQLQVLRAVRDRLLAEFYGALLGMEVIREDWLKIAKSGQSPLHLALDGDGWSDERPPRWGDPEHPQQMHMDVLVPDVEAAGTLVTDLGATLLHDGDDGDDGEDHRVYADRAGHPFCLFADSSAGDDRGPGKLGRVVFDCDSPRHLATFYEGLLEAGRRVEDRPERVVLALDDDRYPDLAFQHAVFVAARWPDPGYPAQLHLDLHFGEGQEAAIQRIERLGGIRLPKLADTEIFADPAGHPFCV